MVVFIIEVVVSTVLKKVNVSNHLSLDGSLLGTRKNPHAIDVGLKLDTVFSYWFIM
jgi:hypothetical protein